MFKNSFMNFLKIFLVASCVGLCELGFSTFAMENFKKTDHLFEIFDDRFIRVMKQGRVALDPNAAKGMYGNLHCNLLEQWKEKWKADFLKNRKEALPTNEEDYEDLVVNDIRNERLNRLRLTFEQIILNYFFTKQERDYYKNNHKNDYSLDSEFDDLFISRVNKNRVGIKFNKEALFDYLLNTYLYMASNYGRCDDQFKNIFKIVFNGKSKEVKVSENRQHIKIHFSPQMFTKMYRERFRAGAIKKGDEDCFSSPEDFKKLCFEIRDEKNPDSSIYLACSLHDLVKDCRIYGENSGCCDCRVMLFCRDNLSCYSVKKCVKNRYFQPGDFLYVTEDFMIVYGYSNILTKNKLLKLEDKHEYIITVYDDAAVNNGNISFLGNVLYSEKIKAESQRAVNFVDSAYRGYVAHTNDFDVIFWLKYYFYNLDQQNMDQLKDLKVKPKTGFDKYADL